jgi:K+-dependent Na+/Ca+ exchanger-like protein
MWQSASSTDQSELLQGSPNKSRSNKSISKQIYELDPDRDSATPRFTPRSLQSDCAGPTDAEIADGKAVNKWQFLWESHCTTIGCPSAPVGDNTEPCLRPEYRGMVVIYIFGAFYMFVALAIVCDELFVPSLECFVDAFEIDMDVAGATFMAAGGSMPELFTSFIGTVIHHSDVGFSTIVGSAVFNILFVIAFCAIGSKEVLELTWWPVFRDMTFYILTLMTVVFVFGISSPDYIEWWEASLLFMEYICYCSFMKFNGQAQAFANRLLGIEPCQVVPTEVVPSEGAAPIPEEYQHLNRRVSFTRPSTFRRGILQLLTQTAPLADTVGVAMVSQMQGTVEEKFDAIDKDKDGFLNESEIQEVLTSLGHKADGKNLKSACQGISHSSDGRISFDSFKKWYIASETRVEVELRRVFDKLTVEQGDTMINAERIGLVLERLGHKPTQDDLADMVREILEASQEKDVAGSADDGSTNKIDIDKVDANQELTFEQFSAWYRKSMFWKEKKATNTEDEEEDEEDGYNLDMPDEGAGWRPWVWFILAYPVTALLYCTVPDCRNGRFGTKCTERFKGNWKFAVVEFAISLIWIAFFATCLYEWAVVSSNTVGIPSPVSGVTILAAGTSVPDLISSYIVAMKGQGDMAVSSSIGSNIFDVTVGLPVPWLIYAMTEGKPKRVHAGNLQVSVPLLILMLAAVLVTIMICRWRMTKRMGYTMLCLYVIFVMVDVLQQLPYNCPLLNFQNWGEC